MKLELKWNIFRKNSDKINKMILYYYNLLNEGCESKFTINSPGTEGSVGLFNIAVPSASCGAPVLLNEKKTILNFKF